MARRHFKIPFAETGDTESIPNETQPDGSVSMQQGYGFDYQRDPQTDPLAKVFPRDVHNGLLNEITASIGEIQQNGYPIWVPEGAPYPVNAVVRHNGQNWQSMIANNNSEPGVDSNWSEAGSAGTDVGMVSQFARITPPAGWLKANGSAVSRTTYSALFAAIGTQFGSGNGSTTFNLPDLRGRFIRGWDDGRGIDSGRAFGSTQDSENKAHFHLQGGGSNMALRYGYTPDLGSHPQDYTTSGNQTGALHTSTEGGTESRPTNIALLVCIKY